MSETVDRIVAASTLPLSIVIVGVGGANFTNMVSARTRHNIYLFFCTTTGYCAQHHAMNHNREFPVISYMYAFISNIVSLHDFLCRKYLMVMTRLSRITMGNR